MDTTSTLFKLENIFKNIIKNILRLLLCLPIFSTLDILQQKLFNKHSEIQNKRKHEAATNLNISFQLILIFK
jgi:hypothetical protein